MGKFPGRQSAWWCLYKEGWTITRTKFVSQLHWSGGGEPQRLLGTPPDHYLLLTFVTIQEQLIAF